MTLIHDIIKIKYVNLGYIKKNYPYHLISDEEMFNAFIDLGNSDFNDRTTLIDPAVRFFDDHYPNPFAEEDYDYRGTSLSAEYTKLKTYIVDTINTYLTQTAQGYEVTIPNWIYSYMLGEVVYQQSEYLDIQDTLVLLKCFNVDNIFTREACVSCYAISLNYVSMLSSGRPATVFGEPHVIKSLRLEN